MEEIKTSENVEFDVIYADGTRRHVSEGVLFEMIGDEMVFHNGTDRALALIGVAEAAAEVVGNMNLSESTRALIIYNIHKRLFGRKDAAAEFQHDLAAKECRIRDGHGAEICFIRQLFYDPLMQMAGK